MNKPEFASTNTARDNDAFVVLCSAGQCHSLFFHISEDGPEMDHLKSNR